MGRGTKEEPAVSLGWAGRSGQRGLWQEGLVSWVCYKGKKKGVDGAGMGGQGHPQWVRGSQ